jgi:tetratricopeptide (TPR) repeat protein
MPDEGAPPRVDPPRKPTGVILRSSLPRFKIEGNIVKILPARLILRDAEGIDRAHDDITRGRVAYAKHVLPALLKKYPLDFDIVEAQARVFEIEEAYDQAIAMLGENIEKFFRFLETTARRKDGLVIPYEHKENKPFIGCLFKVGLYSWYKMQDEAAIGHFKKLLDIDPSDPKGARYFILHLAIGLEWFDDAAGLANRIRRDELQMLISGGSSRLLFGMLYGLGLLVFVLGDLPGAMTMLEFAIKSNPYALANLLEDPRFGHGPIDHVVRLYGGTTSEAEGQGYVDDWGDIWDGVPGSLEFLIIVASGIAKRNKG